MASSRYEGDKVLDRYLKEFDGTVAKYRDIRRAWIIYHSGQTEKNRTLTGVRILGCLTGDAARLFKNKDPEEYRGKPYTGYALTDEEGKAAGKGKGHVESPDDSGFHKIIAELDKVYQWQPESVLFESLETYLYFAPKAR